MARADTARARLTAPILAPGRRGIPPLRVGSVALDLSIPVVFPALSALAAPALPGPGTASCPLSTSHSPVRH